MVSFGYLLYQKAPGDYTEDTELHEAVEGIKSSLNMPTARAQ